MITLRFPSLEKIAAFLDRQQALACSYEPTGMTRGPAPAGYNVDRTHIRLGTGEALFDRARDAMRRWAPHQLGWLRLLPPDVPPQGGRIVAIAVRTGFCWWTIANRIVDAGNEPGPPRRFSFAYGTLVGHAEQGEARFTVEINGDNQVCFEILAYSRPRHWLARLGYPVTRWFQKRFARSAVAAMEHATDGGR
jgi:uncharacterized protein (UPF0548 family)